LLGAKKACGNSQNAGWESRSADNLPWGSRHPEELERIAGSAVHGTKAAVIRAAQTRLGVAEAVEKLFLWSKIAKIYELWKTRI